jgi:XTP/dITP diphosphohydrolase
LIDEIILVSKNKGKLKELRELLSDLNIEINSLYEISPQIDIVEDGESFRENAKKKALTGAKVTGKLSLADDSGLLVEALNGAPGIRSSRFARKDEERVEKLLRLMENKIDRRAKFCCAIAIAFPDGRVEVIEEEVDGKIAERPKGNFGFGYDPIFIPKGFRETFAEMDLKKKNMISHRGKALEKIKEILKKLIKSKN